MRIQEKSTVWYPAGKKEEAFTLHFENDDHGSDKFWIQETGPDEITLNMEWPNEGCPEFKIKKKEVHQLIKVLQHFRKHGNLPSKSPRPAQVKDFNLQKLVR